MKDFGLGKAMMNVMGKGKAEAALDAIPEGGMPEDVPVVPEMPEMPETEAMGPPADLPPENEPMGPPEMMPPGGFNEEVGLPMVAIENTPDEFPGEGNEDWDDEDVLPLALF